MLLHLSQVIEALIDQIEQDFNNAADERGRITSASGHPVFLQMQLVGLDIDPIRAENWRMQRKTSQKRVEEGSNDTINLFKASAEAS